MFDPFKIRCDAGLPLEVKQVAKMLGVSERTVRWFVATNQLPDRRRGTKILVFVEAEVLALRDRRASEREAA